VSGKCVAPCTADNCATCSGASATTCTVCDTGFFLNSGVCEAVAADSDIEFVSTIRYKMAMADYTSNGGKTFFIAQAATALAIDKSLISVTSVKAGSVIVNFKVKSTDSAIKTKLDNAVTAGDMDFYPQSTGILDYQSGFALTSIDSTTTTTTLDDDDDGANVGAIVGGVLGGVALLIVLTLIAYKKGWLASLSKAGSPKSGKAHLASSGSPEVNRA